MRSLLSRWLAAATAGLLSVSVVAALIGVTSEPRPQNTVTGPGPDGVVPLFGMTEKAANEPLLILQADDRGVHGWVAGGVDAVDAVVTLRAGARKYEARIGADNTFFWNHAVNRNTPVTATVTIPGRKEPLTARTTLLRAASKKGDTIFFITDRSAYRPGHTLKFVAFVRTLLSNGEFEPVRERDVTVDLTSQSRGTRAARLKLKSDSFGRVTGEYTFSDADALDHYTLTAADFSGDARVFLGEYRKSKVGLKLAGEVGDLKDGKLTVKFDARDYLDRPVRGTAASYTASVIRNADAAKLTLNPDAFAKPEGGPPAADDFDSLPDDERLLTLANGVSAMTFAGFGSRFIASREGTVAVAKDGTAKLDLDLHPEWLKGGYSITVNGVFTDETGRENRASKTIPLDPKPERGIAISTPKELFATSELIPVSLAPFGLKADEKPATMLLVVRLEAAPASPWVTSGFDSEDADGFLPDNTRIPALATGKAKRPEPDAWKSVPVFDPVKRKIVVGLPVAEKSTEVSLKQPGAYKLVAVTRLADGTTLQSETGVVVKSPARLPGVVLALDKREIDSGSRLTGVVHTRFAGAKMLLTLRDAQGIKLTKPLTAGANGVARIDEALPANLRYGCAVVVVYPENATSIHADQRELFVIPHDRTIRVKTTVPKEVGPGAEINLGIEIDRKEAVDLIVSVFDESLLGVSGDLSRNLRDYYLADARVQGRAARELAATRFGSVTVVELVKKAEELLAEKDRLAREPGLEQQLTGLSDRWKEARVTMGDVVTLVRLAGLEVYLAHPFYPGNDPAWRVPRSSTLADLLRWERRDSEDRNQTVFISATVIGNTALIGTAHPRGRLEEGYIPDPWVGYRGNPYGHGFGGFGVMCGGFNCGGYNQFGFSGALGAYGSFGFRGFGAQFGIGGVGGGLGGLGGGLGGGGLQVGGGNLGAGGGGLQLYSGAQGSFSHPGGQMGFSYGFNRDFGPVGPGGVGPLPGLGVGEEMVRRDFADSAYWTANLRTDANGKATANFKLPDSLTGWRVQVSAVSAKMHVGTGTANFKSTRAIMMWPMLPRTFTEGDTVRVFGTVHNLTEQEQSVKVHLKAENGAVMSDGEQTVKVPAKGNVPVYWTYKAGKKGFTDLLMTATCAAGSDASLKKLQVTAAGIIERATASGLIGKGNLTLTLPEDFDPARASVAVTIAPSLAADLAETLPYLVEYPYGCVEQTMSRFLPAIRVAQILKQYGLSTHKELEAKLPKVVEQGQKRLIELQQPDGGWAWQGNGQTHEMMTPYALFGLIAAEEAGYPCPNPSTIPNGMAVLKRYLNQMGAAWWLMTDLDKSQQPNSINDALFCLWVYSQHTSDRDAIAQQELTAWWKPIELTIGKPVMSDYGHALTLELAVKFKQKELADKLAAELRKRARKSGDQVYWTTAGFSRWGDNTIEVTAMVMKALVAYNADDPLIPGVLSFFHATKRGDRWDSTKDTACVLYALCDYLAAVRAGPAAAGMVKVSVNGGAAQEVKLDGPASKVVKFDGATIKPGGNTITITGTETTGGALARVVVSYSRGRAADIPARDHGVKVERVVSVRNADGVWSELKSGATVPLGSYIKVRVRVPAAATKLSYTLLESPKPGGGETVPADDPRFRPGPDATGHVLREDREAFTAFHYEYAPVGFAAEYVVLAEFAGEFQLPPARVELMYKPTIGGHSDSFVLKVN